MNEKYPDGNWYRVNSYFDFFGSQVILINVGYEASSYGGEPVVAYSRENLIDKVKEYVAYQEIMK